MLTNIVNAGSRDQNKVNELTLNTPGGQDTAEVSTRITEDLATILTLTKSFRKGNSTKQPSTCSVVLHGKVQKKTSSQHSIKSGETTGQNLKFNKSAVKLTCGLCEKYGSVRKKPICSLFAKGTLYDSFKYPTSIFFGRFKQDSSSN